MTKEANHSRAGNLVFRNKPGQAYHVWALANGSENLFRCNENYPHFLENVKSFSESVGMGEKLTHTVGQYRSKNRQERIKI